MTFLPCSLNWSDDHRGLQVCMCADVSESPLRLCKVHSSHHTTYTTCSRFIYSDSYVPMHHRPLEAHKRCRRRRSSGASLTIWFTHSPISCCICGRCHRAHISRRFAPVIPRGNQHNTRRHRLHRCECGEEQLPAWDYSVRCQANHIRAVALCVQYSIIFIIRIDFGFAIFNGHVPLVEMVRSETFVSCDFTINLPFSS